MPLLIIAVIVIVFLCVHHDKGWSRFFLSLFLYLFLVGAFVVMFFLSLIG